MNKITHCLKCKSNNLFFCDGNKPNINIKFYPSDHCEKCDINYIYNDNYLKVILMNKYIKNGTLQWQISYSDFISEKCTFINHGDNKPSFIDLPKDTPFDINRDRLNLLLNFT